MKKTVILAAVTAVSIAAASCGIDDMVYIEPPLAISASANAFEFTHQANVYDNLFYGYEVFYRIYTSAADASADAATIANWNTNSPGTVHANIVSLGYKMMKRGNDFGGITLPIPDADLDETIPVSLDFSAVNPSANEGQIKLRYGSSPEVDLYRGMSTGLDEPNLYEFNYIIASGEIQKQDVKYNEASTDPHLVQAYVFASRLNEVTFNVDYSTASFLGTVANGYIIVNP